MSTNAIVAERRARKAKAIVNRLNAITSAQATDHLVGLLDETKLDLLLLALGIGETVLVDRS